MRTSPVLITGGTGTLGRLVVSRLQDASRDLRVLSRHGHESTDGIDYVTGDLLNDEGIEPAVEGAEIIMYLAGGPRGDDEATRNLVRAASRAGTRHLVYISVIGADRVPLRYFTSKLAAEQAVADSGLPFTTLRAAQFHDIVLTMAQKMAKMPVLPVPSAVRLQPVDADEVAARLVDLALAEPAGQVPDPARTGPARTCHSKGLWASAPGGTSWQHGCAPTLRPSAVSSQPDVLGVSSSGGAGYSSRSMPSLKRRSAACSGSSGC